MGFTESEVKMYSHQAKTIKPVLANEMLKILVEVQRAIKVNLDPENSLLRFLIASILIKKKLVKNSKKVAKKT